ncbi:glycine/betaine ABC transporter substrate-binding protein [Roseibacterium sp. SDUM158016]|jgi:glycine betaine/proline transport system substrate-binding protein|uniref:glycine betaine ABC transporter substrate-binding protein n=1 Tax=Roseicyclus sediminis TaxID=2980997 RepID=UPI0021D1AD28|nr:glycine betaine ABC transporter substrate-binding protein [Roseibacterium sp. SDUM158016]MCU4652647.1 glycine/betaine ABC transporter substrate-binding protein [Roseibacterium sp. SDUM158016]
MKALSVCTVLVGLTGTAAFADCGEIEITEFDFSSAQVNAEIAKFILEQGYGCDVALVPSSTTSAIASISATGSPDVLTEIWENAAGVLREMQGNGEVTFLQNVLSEGGQQGWWVPQYLVDEHPELATIEGILANPDLVGGRFYSCPDGWTCNFTNGHIAEAYDLEGAGIEVFVPGSGEVLATSLASAYADRQPWLGYYWAPSPLLGENPMVLVDLGPYDPEAFSCNASEDCQTPGPTSYPRDEVWTIVTTALTEREPEATAMLSRMAFTNQELGAVLAWQEANGASAEEAAVYFLTNFPDVWGGWLNDSARENLSALLQ